MLQFVFLFVILLPGSFAPGGHHGHDVHAVHDVHAIHIQNCFNHTCSGHHSQCLIKDERGSMVGSCAEHHDCHNHCSQLAASFQHAGGCCCQDQPCVDSVKAHHIIATTTVHCQECHDVRNNDCEHHVELCDDDERCRINYVDFHIETKCVPKHDCDGHGHPDPLHHDPAHHAPPGHHHHHDPHHQSVQTTYCCQNDSCVASALALATKPSTVATLTTAQMSTIQPIVTDSSPVMVANTQPQQATTAALCMDVEDVSYCTQNANTLCSATDAATHVKAVTTCAHTCNFCIEYLVLQGTSAPAIVNGGSSTMAPTALQQQGQTSAAAGQSGGSSPMAPVVQQNNITQQMAAASTAAPQNGGSSPMALPSNGPIVV